MRLHDRELGLPRVRRAAGEAVEEHTAEGVDVRAAVELLAQDLLRGAVVHGTEEEPRLGCALRARVLGDAEVTEVGVLLRLSEKDVGRLDVAVDEPGAVGGVERAPDLVGDPQRLGRGQRSALLDHRLQAWPPHVAHGEIKDAVDLPGVVDRDHVRMVE